MMDTFHPQAQLNFKLFEQPQKDSLKATIYQRILTAKTLNPKTEKKCAEIKMDEEERRLMAQAWRQRHENHIKQLSTQKVQKINKENIVVLIQPRTKQPISQRGLQFRSNRSSYGKLLQMNVLQRNEWWQSQRKSKLIEKTNKQQNLKLQQCTFKPVLNTKRSNSCRNQSNLKQSQVQSYFLMKKMKSERSLNKK